MKLRKIMAKNTKNAAKIRESEYLWAEIPLEMD
jgi:hypothetical protein